jgi:transposase InsO family protein
MIVSDNGTEFPSNAILGWAKNQGVDWHYIAQGKPMRNGYVEPFNGRVRGELPHESLFIDLDRASPGADSLRCRSRKLFHESRIRENCTSGLCGGRRQALHWAPPPTRQVTSLARLGACPSSHW